MRQRGGSPDGHPVLSKLRRYWRWLKAGELRSTYQLPPTAPVLCLVVTPSYDRRNHLARLARLADDRQSGSPFFRFCARPDYDPATDVGARAFLGPIWRTPKTRDPCRLFD